METKQNAIIHYLQNEPIELPKDDLSVRITLHRLPATLVRSFALKVAYQYPGGISEAIQELMKQTIARTVPQKTITRPLRILSHEE